MNLGTLPLGEVSGEPVKALAPTPSLNPYPHSVGWPLFPTPAYRARINSQGFRAEGPIFQKR